MARERKSKIARLFLACTLGYLGGDRFYMNKIITGIIKFILFLILLSGIIYLAVKIIPTYEAVFEKAEEVGKQAAAQYAAKNPGFNVKEAAEAAGKAAAIEYIIKYYKIEIIISIPTILLSLIMFIWWIVDILLAVLYIFKIRRK